VTREQAEKALANVLRWTYTHQYMEPDDDGKWLNREYVLHALEAVPDAEEWKARAEKAEAARLREAFVAGCRSASNEVDFNSTSEALRRYPDAEPVEQMMRCRLADDCPYRKDCPLSKPHVENQDTPLQAPPASVEGHQCKYVFCKWSTGCGTECLPIEQPAEPEDILAGLNWVLGPTDQDNLRILARRIEDRAVARAVELAWNYTAVRAHREAQKGARG
jgi:hypothetical protein